MPVDHDRLFKELLMTYFEEFMLLFFPEAYEAIDFQEIRFLPEELYTDVTAGEKYRVDLLAETKLKGEDGLIIIHVEPQSYVQEAFSERMFIYFSRLYETYRRKILPIAIFSYDKIREEPATFEITFPFTNVLQFNFLTVQLKKKNWRDFIRSENPVAAALLSKMGYNESEKIEVKKEFLRMLVRMNIDAARQTLISGFFETYLQLTPEEEEKLLNEVKKMSNQEGEKVMELMVSYERRGMEKGMEIGKEEGKKLGKGEGKIEERINIAKSMLKKEADENFITEVTGLSYEEIELLKKELE
ncbi:Rpn family recombination-promoting nuclease/putative transposase [Texcoconibacillus texcoconensis]|uniref:Putative transposase/invertase (TIGR01784 family) n=1 Tax=Texcoconibacillus texcoconensis TaxID=1095777 RepID=A0A840QU24_9BACI|nr:Rpn family recombination-promoting nuclease/putative transposase [Texcoconibacillus texcoconensis]MBB5175056.1 putative transposase/invertase (TIGR01784 family) [Texcoconibacillus texcoconensis]